MEAKSIERPKFQMRNYVGPRDSTYRCHYCQMRHQNENLKIYEIKRNIYIFFRYLYVIEKYFGLKNPKSACNLWRPHCHYFRLISNKMRIFSNFHVPVTQDKTWFYYWLTKIEWIFELYFSHSERTRAFLLKQEVRPIRPIK